MAFPFNATTLECVRQGSCVTSAGSCTERETCRSDAKGEVPSGQNREDESTDAEHRGGVARSRDEGSVMGLDRRGCVFNGGHEPPEAISQQEGSVDEVKPVARVPTSRGSNWARGDDDGQRN